MTLARYGFGAFGPLRGSQGFVARAGIAILAVWLTSVGPFLGLAGAEPVRDEVLANLIWRIEGGEFTRYPYGIKSIDTGGDVVNSRRICLNTIRNQRVRHANHTCGLDFIGCLAQRYCPPQAHPLNRNWERNLRSLLRKVVNVEAVK